MWEKRWTPERDETLAELWPTHKASWDGWSEALGFPATPSAIYSRACKLGLNNKRRPYSEQEEELLVRIVERYCDMTGKTFGSVVRKLDQIQAKRYATERKLRNRSGD